MTIRTRLAIYAAVLLGTVAPATLLGPVAATSAAPASTASAANPAAVPAVRPAGNDPTVTRRARSSRAARGGISVRAWVNSATARRIIRAESGGNCRAVSPGGKYRGKWQMDRSFWRTYGGLAYASTPDRASCAQQDIVAHRGWVARWWQPWSTF